METNSPPNTTLTSVFDAHAQGGHSELDALQLEMAGLGGNGNSRSSSASGGNNQHPNIFVRGLPLAWSEAEITAVFQQYGQLSSLRLVRHSVTKQSLGYGFVRFQEPGEAQAAISSLDGTSVLGHTLQVKFADADAGPPSSGSSSGMTPSDSCYVKHLPATYGMAEVQQLFEVHGAVLDVKLFPCLDQFRGASALVRMASVEAADRAISALNNSTPPGGVQSLIVRFAESPNEKAARLTRRERQQLLQRTGLQAALSGGLDPMQLQQAIAALSMNGMVGGASGVGNNGMGGGQGAALHMRGGNVGSGGMNNAPLVTQQYQPLVQSSLCVKGMPANADRLWMYENFARFGAVAGMRILIDEQTGMCNGTGFINFADQVAAERARQAMNGMRAGERILHVVVQQSARPGSGNNGMMPNNLNGGAAAGVLQAQPNDWQQILQQGGGGMVW